MVEHLTVNQGVLGSNPKRIAKQIMFKAIVVLIFDKRRLYYEEMGIRARVCR